VLEAPSSEDLASCAALLRAGSKSFFAASLALPRRVRDPATVVYAFCRIMDDAIDDGADAPRALEDLRARLDRVYRDAPQGHPVDRALARVVRAHDLPRVVFDGLLEGFAWDVEGRSYETLDDVIDYGVRVAGTVGVAMSVLMDRRDADVLDRACELGVAMQLTNIARDVGEDARNGRVYLPRAWLTEAGVDARTLVGASRPSEGVRAVVLRLLDAAGALYRHAAIGIRFLPRDCRPSIRAARSIYAAIGADVSKHGGDTISRRATVSTARKVWLLARSLAPSEEEARPHPGRFAPAHYLVEQVAR
jgi:15-cis-phytoene synthase